MIGMPKPTSLISMLHDDKLEQFKFANDIEDRLIDVLIKV